MIGGGLFSRYYLDEGVRQGSEWLTLSDAEVEAFAAAARGFLAKVPASGKLGEAETETLLIFPTLAALGWSHLPQQKGATRRDDVPDALLFLDAETQKHALTLPAGYGRWKQAAVVNENKAWDLPLDRASGKTARTPASQALRYLRLGDEHTGGALRWALLTNGRQWRLYFAGAASMADRFLEVDLPALVEGADTPEGVARLRTFILFFRRAAFAPGPAGRSFLLAAMEEGREWQERVTADLSRAVFATVYPELLKALGAADPTRHPADPAWPDTVRQNAVVLLYRLLFLLYAEDRDLLPVDHRGYQPRSLSRLRQDVAEAVDDNRPLSDTDAFWWGDLKALFNAVDKGSDTMGLPAYNGGLFNPNDAPMLHAVALPDRPLAAILDGLSRRQDGTERRRINYRDLSVQQLGAIYERLLDFDVEVDGDGAVVLTKDSVARKVSGSFYTPPSLVRLILDSTIGPHVTHSQDRFRAKAEALKGDRRPVADRIADLRRFDPAEALLNLKLADPAMGSGHFLVSVVDRLADAVLLAMEEAAVIAQTDGGVAGYTSPLADRIEAERARIEGAAQAHGWPYRAEHLDDRHLVRRLVLKRAVYGVDRNPLAVELAKLSLWLHSFTVGAPLSFLDHHLRHGDSLFGAWVADTGDQLAKRGSMLLHQAVDNARGAAAGMALNAPPAASGAEKPGIGLTMFGVTTACVTMLREALEPTHECYVFHATGAGGRSMEKLADSGLVSALVDVTTTEVPDFLMGGVFPCDADRFGAAIRTRLPYVGSVGAVDMVNFGAMDTVPAQFAGRNLYVHNPQVTLMRTTPEENRAIGRFIVERLNAMEGPVRFLLPLGGVSAIDVPGMPFHDPAADAALFETIRAGFAAAPNRRLVEVQAAINDPAFVDAVLAAFREIA